MNYTIFVSELRVYRQMVYEINKLKQKVEEIEYIEQGVKGVSFDNIPHSLNPTLQAEKRLELIDQKERLEEEIKRLELKKKMVIDQFDRLDEHTKLICLDIIDGKTFKQIGEAFGYSESGIMRKLKKEIEKV